MISLHVGFCFMINHCLSCNLKYLTIFNEFHVISSISKNHGLNFVMVVIVFILMFVLNQFSLFIDDICILFFFISVCISLSVIIFVFYVCMLLYCIFCKVNHMCHIIILNVELFSGADCNVHCMLNVVCRYHIYFWWH